MVFDKKRFRSLTDEVADELGLKIRVIGFRKSVFYSVDGDDSVLGTLIHTPFDLEIFFSLDRGETSTITIQVDPLDSDESIKNKVKTSLGSALLLGLEKSRR